MLVKIFRWLLLCNLLATAASSPKHGAKRRLCSSLSKYQYQCNRLIIDPDTQQPSTCQPDNSVMATCLVADGITCDGLINGTRTFMLRIPDSCDNNAHVSFSTALLLSIFLGFFGLDRIYLGYYAVGLFKMFSLGGLFILWLTDVVLIALQVLLPADGTGYVMPAYGPRTIPLRFDPSCTNYSLYTCADCM